MYKKEIVKSSCESKTWESNGCWSNKNFNTNDEID